MSEVAIRAEGVSKLYHLGATERYSTIRESIVRGVRVTIDRLQGRKDALAAKPSHDLWALRDVSFEVKTGEVLGIIGRNGAGKSTLLKILSRITEPTEGKIEINGRIASLLEVGTGFHPELTGRENVYLNGSILGMRKREIDRKFDEIADFSGVERFLDTPVKHYSSGMAVRLAFAVAAHLDSEILIIDEVLAVGDVEFQEKCLGKMELVARSGRTIIFISHDLGAVVTLCTKVALIENGKIITSGTPADVVGTYLHRIQMGTEHGRFDRRGHARREGSEYARIVGGEITSEGRFLRAGYPAGEPLEFHIDCIADISVNRPVLGIGIDDPKSGRVLTLQSAALGNLKPDHDVGGLFHFHCVVPNPPLAPGEYTLRIVLESTEGRHHVIEHACVLIIIKSDFYRNGSRFLSGHAIAAQSWSLKR